jgi:probable HAF family extracellular repeat protein
MRSLGTLGGDYSAAFAVNNSGQIVGESSVASGEARAFLFSGGVMQNLEALGGSFGGNYSTASAVNNLGHVVGYALNSVGDARAFLYDGSKMLHLDSFLGPTAVCTNLISADGINDDGQITGAGYDASGAYHAFLFTPAFALRDARVSNGEFVVTAVGFPGQRFVFMASTNLSVSNWVALATNSLVTNTFECVDPNASIRPARFYRALLLP